MSKSASSKGSRGQGLPRPLDPSTPRSLSYLIAIFVFGVWIAFGSFTSNTPSV